MDKEIWRDIPGFSNKQASSLGNVRDTDYRGTGKVKPIKVRLNYAGYLICSLGRVHRLVALAFVSNDNPKLNTQVNHIDENKENNRADNLEWVSPKYNANYGTRNKRISAAQVGKKPTWEWTEERRAAASYRQRGENNTFYGHKHSNSSKKKISEKKQKTKYRRSEQ